MVFHSKVDKFYRIVLGLTVLTLALCFLLPIALDDALGKIEALILLSILLVSLLFILWTALGIRYELREDELYVRGGPIYSHIPYTSIKHVEPFDGLTGGFVIASARKGIAITYQKGFGYLVISPTEREVFMAELEKRIIKARA